MSNILCYTCVCLFCWGFLRKVIENTEKSVLWPFIPTWKIFWGTKKLSFWKTLRLKSFKNSIFVFMCKQIKQRLSVALSKVCIVLFFFHWHCMLLLFSGLVGSHFHTVKAITTPVALACSLRDHRYLVCIFMWWQIFFKTEQNAREEKSDKPPF